MLTALVLAAATVAAPSPPPAQSTSSPVAAAAARTLSASELLSEKLICRRTEETGSRTNTRKLCLTRAGWAKYEDDGQSGTEYFQAHSRGLCLSGATCQ